MATDNKLCSAVFSVLFLLSVAAVHADQTPAFVWIRSVAGWTATPQVKTTVEDDGKPTLLSGGSRLKIDLSPDDVKSQVPSSGVQLQYSFATSSAGSYQVWDRVGFEAVRSDFSWRIDGGQWAKAASTDATTDVEELQTWNPIGWLKLGSVDLTAGNHMIQLLFVPETGTDGKLKEILYASDALCLYNGEFHPNDGYEPGDESYLTADDKAAADRVVTIPSPSATAQQSTSLSGRWQIARDDEQVVENPSGPISVEPAQNTLYWRSIAVPGNRDAELPEWLYNHRYWLRTHVFVPQSLSGHSLYLHFPSTSMIATVFVNGTQCGYSNAPFAPWDCDITGAVTPGAVNEIAVGIKDWYYALPDQGAVDGGHLAYIPTDWVTKFGPATFTFPVWNHTENGIIQAPSILTAGQVYTSDIFVQPSVSKHILTLAVTVHNPTSTSQTINIGSSIVPAGSNSAALTIPSQSVTVPPGQDASVTLTAPFQHPKLWWPDSPSMYTAITSVTTGGNVIDSRSTSFGFREWTWSGDDFSLNGVPWHGRADLVDYGRADDQAVSTWHAHGQTMVRMWGEDSFSGLSPDDALDFFDQNGIVVRRTGIFDGEAASYNLVSGGKVNQELFHNWQNQLLAWVKGERNHPSIFIWSIENEIAFINAHVFGLSATVDPAEGAVAAAVEAEDPTRPVMTDGGNALLDQSLPVDGCHYIEPPLASLPEGAYHPESFLNSQEWPITSTKPILLGESFYANGDQPSDLATIGGEDVFAGKAAEGPAIGTAAKMYSEGLRWDGINFHFWIGGESNLYYNSWQPVAALCRQWDWTFASGQTVKRTVRIFNDTHDSSAIQLTAKLTLNGTVQSSTVISYIVPEGGYREQSFTLPMPSVQVRSEGTWSLTLARNGRVVFTNSYPCSVVPPPYLHEPSNAEMAVYDPQGGAAEFLSEHHIPFVRIANLSNVPQSAKVLLVGSDSLTTQQATSSALAAFASSGKSVVVLEQIRPLKFQALPAEMDIANDSGDLAFVSDSGSPIINGLRNSDFISWGKTGELYNGVYRKSSAGTSIMECGQGLSESPLVEFTPGNGDLVLCQLKLESNLSDSGTAQQLLINLLRSAISYKPVRRQTYLFAQPNNPLTDALDAIHLSYKLAADPIEAIDHSQSIAIVDGSAETLAALAAHKDAIDSFTQTGGWIILNGLTPDGLVAYNHLVGVDHMIRPFRSEKVSLAEPQNSLTLGLSNDDVVMGNGQNIFNWEAGQYPDPNEFTSVVDTGDIAPFCSSPFFGWGQIINGYTMADGFWPLIINFPAPADGQVFDIPITLPKPERISGFTFVGDNNYWPQTKLILDFGSGDTVPLSYDHGAFSSPAQPAHYVIDPPRLVSNFDLKITGWDKLPNVTPNIGIDNISFDIVRPSVFNERVKPMLNVGGMVEYPHGAGGIILCNLKFQPAANEANPQNAIKKQTIIATILRNLKAQFAGGAGIIAGSPNLTYTPINLENKVNQYIGPLGWFGDKDHTFADFPTGRQVLAGVPYSIYNFTTSPVPTVVMLGGNNIPGNLPGEVDGISIDQKADALFFLQSARIDQPLSDDELKNHRQSEMADYIVHYADGSSATVPIYVQGNLDNYLQQLPNALPGAQIAWIRPYAGSNQNAVAYSMQWQNPSPEKTITTVDLKYGPDRWRGIPCLIALTAATDH